MLQRMYQLVFAVALAAIPAAAQSGAAEKATADALASLIRNAAGAEVSAEGELLRYLEENGIAPDLASLLALAVAPVALGADAGAPDDRVEISGECLPALDQPSAYRCSLSFGQITWEGPEATESNVIFRFRLNGAPEDPTATLLGPVEVFLAG